MLCIVAVTIRWNLLNGLYGCLEISWNVRSAIVDYRKGEKMHFDRRISPKEIVRYHINLKFWSTVTIKPVGNLIIGASSMRAFVGFLWNNEPITRYFHLYKTYFVAYILVYALSKPDYLLQCDHAIFKVLCKHKHGSV